MSKTQLDFNSATLKAKRINFENLGGVNMEGRIKSLEETVSTLAQTVSSLTKRLSDAEGQINNKVDKNNVLGSINKTEEDSRIKGDKIHIDKNTLMEHGVFNN